MKHLIAITSIVTIGYGIDQGRWAFVVCGVLIGLYAIGVAASKDKK